MDKPLREITVGEWKAICDQRTQARKSGDSEYACPECSMSSICAATPDEWALPEDTPTAGDDTPTEGTKPRLAEVLGVEVGEKFRYKNPLSGFVSTPLYISESGEVMVCGVDNREDPAHCILAAINHPESIIRAPRLTEAERAICKDVGAKWVSRGALGTKTVVLWDAKPECFDDGTFGSTDTAHKLARMYTGFDSVHLGNCICVEEAGEK